MDDIWGIINYIIFVSITGFIVAYVIFTVIRIAMKKFGGRRKARTARVLELYVGGSTGKTSFCGLSEKHIHYRVMDTINHDNERHVILYHYCPLTRRVFIVKPKPLTPDEVRYGWEFEGKSNVWGE